jgi:hypothetical protein
LFQVEDSSAPRSVAVVLENHSESTRTARKRNFIALLKFSD